MKVLVAYASKYGATGEVAAEMAKTIREEGHEADLADLRKGYKGDLSGYDLVILGSGIIAFNWIKGARKFLEKRADELSRTRTAVFAVGSEPYFEPEKREEQLSKYVEGPASERGIDPSAAAVFGGVFDFSKYGKVVTAVLTKMGIKDALTGAGFDVSRPCDMRDWDEIRGWARSLL